MYKTSPTQKVGDFAEQKAAEYLIEAGCQIIQKNFMSKLGEIDLIIQDKEMLVFVEVRYRQKEDYGSGAESVTRGKQRKIIRAAQYYLQKNKMDHMVACRFDVVSITQAGQSLEIDWIKDAFQ